MRQKARRYILVQSSVLEGAPEAPSWQDKDGLREIVSESYNHRNQTINIYNFSDRYNYKISFIILNFQLVK